jgi:4-amino-4-deoxy-L-arabinose transferase-like glycosyltransferase
VPPADEMPADAESLGVIYTARTMIQRIDQAPNSRPRRGTPEPAVPVGDLLLFAVGLALRAAYAWFAMGPGATPSSDAVSYDAVAWNLARGAGFALNSAGGPYPTAFVPPALPFVTSLLYRVAGHQFFGAILLQCLIGALVPVLLARFARQTFGPGPGRFAGWLAAVNPLMVFFSGYLLTETLFSFALLVALFATTAWIKAPRRGRALGAGMLWGLAALTRPTALPLPMLVVLWAWHPLALIAGGRERVRQCAALLLGLALVVAPWTLRNGLRLGAFVPVTTGGGRSLLDANNPIVWDDPAQRGGATSVYGLEPYAAQFRGLSEHDIDVRSGVMAREFLMSRQSEWMSMAGAKLARYWRVTSEGGRTGSWQKRGSPVDRLRGLVDPLLLWSLVVLPLALWGVVTTLRSPRALYLSLPLLIVLAFTLGAIVYWGSLRLRVPTEPLVTVYAAAGLDALLQMRRVQKSGMKVVMGRRAGN